MVEKKPIKPELNFLDHSDQLIDSDHDGLSDVEEKAIGTNPEDPDTDNDGLNDFEEVRNGRNPLGPGLWRDLFIPNAGNNYQPQSLHPKRLLLYAVGAVAIKFIALFLVILVPVTAWLTPDVMKQESLQIISLTNNLRQGLNLNSLQTNSLLQQAAANKAQDMLINQYFAHVSPDKKRASTWVKETGYQYRVIGENLALGFASSQDVVSAWINSPTHYANLVDKDYDDIGVAMVSGTFNGYDTTLVAQFFGDPIVTAPPVIEPAPKPITPPVIEPTPAPTPKPVVPEENNVPEPTPITPPSEPEPENLPVSPPVTEPAPEPINPPITEEEPIPGEQPEIVLPPMPAPQLMSPANEMVTNQNEITLEIVAIQAEKVRVWLDNQMILETAKASQEDSLNLKVNVVEGTHSIQLESVRGEQHQLSASYIVIVDNTPPQVDDTKTVLMIDQPAAKQEKIIKATAFLSADTEKAFIEFSNRQILLTYDERNNEWSGQLLLNVDEQAETFNPVVLATITASDHAGNTSVSDVAWENIEPMETSIADQYVYLKTNPSKELRPIFGFGDWYYRILLVIAVLALALSTFIKFKRQDPKTIVGGISFICLLAVLLIL